MDATMAWSKVSRSDTLGDVMSLLDQVVTDYRNRGHSRTLATEQAALALGITPRRAKSLLYGEAFSVTIEELKSIRAKYLTHLDGEADHLAMRSAAARARRRQAELDL